jgi:hypothetical protein
VPERSFAIGTIAEAIESLGPFSEAFTPKLYPIIIATMKDEDEEVRSNAIFACGVLAMNGGPTMIQYPLQTLLCVHSSGIFVQGMSCEIKKR